MMADGWKLRITHTGGLTKGAFREVYAWIEDAHEAETAVRREEGLSPEDRVEASCTISGTAFEAMGFAPGQVDEYMGTPPSGS